MRSRLKWAGHMDRMGDEKLATSIRCPESGGKEEARKIESAIANTWRTAANGEHQQMSRT